MSNQLAAAGRVYFADEWLVDVYKLVLLKPTYTFDAAHENLSDVPSGERVAISPALAAKTNVEGYCASDPAVLPGVAAGSTVGHVWLFRSTGTEATSTLIAYYDTKGDGTPIALATNGGTIEVTPNPAGWFRL